MTQSVDLHAAPADSSGYPTIELNPAMGPPGGPEPTRSTARRALAHEALTLFFSGLIHVACWVGSTMDSNCTATYHIGAGLQLAALTGLLAAMLATPASFLRMRVYLLLPVKLAMYLPPSSRGLVGVPQVLQREASPGVRGTMADAYRLFVGERGG